MNKSSNKYSKYIPNHENKIKIHNKVTINVGLLNILASSVCSLFVHLALYVRLSCWSGYSLDWSDHFPQHSAMLKKQNITCMDH